jgi:hypothetical protein
MCLQFSLLINDFIALKQVVSNIKPNERSVELGLTVTIDPIHLETESRPVLIYFLDDDAITLGSPGMCEAFKPGSESRYICANALADGSLENIYRKKFSGAVTGELKGFLVKDILKIMEVSPEWKYGVKVVELLLGGIVDNYKLEQKRALINDLLKSEAFFDGLEMLGAEMCYTNTGKEVVIHAINFNTFESRTKINGFLSTKQGERLTQDELIKLLCKGYPYDSNGKPNPNWEPLNPCRLTSEQQKQVIFDFNKYTCDNGEYKEYLQSLK